jgi:hypothetical protein
MGFMPVCEPLDLCHASHAVPVLPALLPDRQARVVVVAMNIHYEVIPTNCFYLVFAICGKCQQRPSSCQLIFGSAGNSGISEP